VALIQAFLDDEAGSDSQDTDYDASVFLPKRCKYWKEAAANTTYLSEILPDLLCIIVLSLPLFPNDLGYFRVGDARVASDDGVLVVLAIKDERYKEASVVSPRMRPQTKKIFFVSQHSPSQFWPDTGCEFSNKGKKLIQLTISRAGYLGLWLAKTHMHRQFSRPRRRSTLRSSRVDGTVRSRRLRTIDFEFEGSNPLLARSGRRQGRSRELVFLSALDGTRGSGGPELVDPAALAERSGRLHVVGRRVQGGITNLHI
jgi:hypothetical protein